jgi:flagellar basal-body rod modification protein FlgD
MSMTVAKQVATPAAAAANTAAVAAGSTAAAASAGTQARASGAASAFQDLLASMRQQAGADGARDASSAASGAGGSASASETEDRFLKLLVAQMKNQDPLNPLDNAQVTTQLAQINTVRGIERLNASMTALLERDTGAPSTTEAAAMVGRRVLVEGNALELPKDGVARAGFELATDASSVRVDVLDTAGKVVDTVLMSNLSAGLHAFEWDGQAGDRTLEPGRYALRIEASGAEGPVTTTPFRAAPVVAVTRGADGAPVLQLGTGGSRPLDAVRGVL